MADATTQGEKVAALHKGAEEVEKGAQQLQQGVDHRNELAADRTVYAAERTYAAWVRTGLIRQRIAHDRFCDRHPQDRRKQ